LDITTADGSAAFRAINHCLYTIQCAPLGPLAAAWDQSLQLPADVCQLSRVGWYTGKTVGRKILLPLELTGDPLWGVTPQRQRLVRAPGGLLQTGAPFQLALDWWIVWQVCGSKLGVAPHPLLVLGADPWDYLSIAVEPAYIALAQKYSMPTPSTSPAVYTRARNLRRLMSCIQTTLKQSWQPTGQTGGRFSSSPNNSDSAPEEQEQEQHRKSEEAAADAPRNNDGRLTCFWCDAPTKEFLMLDKKGHICTNPECGR